MKLNTSHKIAILLSFIFLTLIFIIILPFLLQNNYILIQSNLLLFILLNLISVIGFYFISKTFINKFIYERVKVIYKNIYEFKRASKVVETDLDEVDKEVKQWTEKRILENQKKKDSSQFRREFLGNVSHELKTPIFNIQGYVQTLLDGALEDPDVNKRYLQRANKSVDRMINIVEDLEIITRLESEKIDLQFEKIDLQNLIKEAFEQLELNAKKKKIQLLESNSPPVKFVYCDKNKILQVLINLITNSIKYGNQNGKTEIRYYDMDKNILIEIADNGLGIKKKHLSHLFERFYRVDKNRSREIGGTGLGLAIVKHIIEAHKQTVNIRSTYGKGSTFSFTLEKRV